MAIMDALQLDLLTVGAHRLGRLQNRVQYHCSQQQYCRYFVAPSKPCKWSDVLAQAIQLTAVQDVDVTSHVLSDFRSMLQWTNSNITIMMQFTEILYGHH